ncbi:MAG: NAD(P)/FAD-dependent oxidoreductase [Candidatus Aminicenantes bacterium]|nr:NAD(P)/FAD-dependent oxidoreductase [Candidatus Aminicenantes bacterium]
MRVVIAGNGLAGTMAAKTLRELDAGVEIVVLAAEAHPYYPRPNLIDYLAGRLPLDRVFAFPPGWTEKNRIDVRLGRAVETIRPASREVLTADGGREPYDALLLALGSVAALPPIPGAEKRGVFTLKTLDDAQAILDDLKGRSRVAVIGGGVLGLEIARALTLRGAAVTVVEVFNRLLPRQLDGAGASVLREQIERLGIAVRLQAETGAILGGDEASGLRLKGGEEIAADMIVAAVGVRPNLEIARTAGLAVERGLVVDDDLATSRPGIFAAGDVVQHRGRVYGIIPAAFDQARAAAHNILGQTKPYQGSVVSNTLKVAGLYVTSIGEAQPEAPGYIEFRREDRDTGIYKKVVLKDGVLVGAVWMGTKAGVTEISRAVASGTKVGARGESLLDDAFDFTLL